MDRRISQEEVVAIGERLRELREKLMLTQQEFADKLFWDVSSYQKIESGKTMMTLDKAIQIHREYEVDLNYFVAGDSIDEEEVLKQLITSASKEKSTKAIIRLLEYFISLLESSLKE